MRSFKDSDFDKLFARLPKKIQVKAVETFNRWKNDPWNPKYDFHKLEEPYYKINIGYRWRAIGYLMDDSVYWIFIGSHETYNNFIEHLPKRSKLK
jgi:hypothetical protein